MDISEIRKQYPQYADLPDDQLAKGFHAKFYADMSYEQFAGKIGIKPEAKPPVENKFDYEAYKEKGWGSGAEAAAYKLGGVVSDFAARFLPPEVAGALGYVTNVAAGAVPALLGGGGAGKAAPVLEKAGSSLMQSALKPSVQAMQKGQGQRAIKTMLEEGLNVTSGGLNTLQTKITALNKQVTEIIGKSNATVDITPITRSAKVLEMRATNQASWADDLKTVQDSFREFLNNPNLVKLNDRLQDVPVQVAQQLKSGTQRSVANAYGTKGDTWEESQKAIGHVLREGIEKVVPKVVPLNAKESELINALNIAERRDMMAANKNPIGIGLISADPKAMAMMLADRSELFKSLIARMLYSGRERIPQAVVGSGIAATQGQEP